LLSTVLKDFPIQSPAGSGSDQLEAITSGPDRSVWFLDNLGNAEQLGKISPSGSITWFPIINDPNAGNLNTANHLTTGPDRDVWFNTSSAIGKITPAGVITLYPAPAVAPSISGLTPSEDGNVWFTGSLSSGGNDSQTEGVVGRITPSGVITTFPILTGPLADQVGTGPIVEGRDGNVWFGALIPTENGNGNPELEVGRVTPSGQITLHPIWQAQETMEAGVGFDLVSGPDRNPWLIDGGLPLLNSEGKQQPPAILRIDPSGHFKTFPISLASDRLLGAGASGLRGSLYFSITDNNYDDGPIPQPTIGARSPSGRVSFTALPKQIAPDFTFGGSSTPQPMTVGPDGNLWFISTDTVAGMSASLGPAIVRLKTH
jgi:virginiamycin B lyase